MSPKARPPSPAVSPVEEYLSRFRSLVMNGDEEPQDKRAITDLAEEIIRVLSPPDLSAFTRGLSSICSEVKPDFGGDEGEILSAFNLSTGIIQLFEALNKNDQNAVINHFPEKGFQWLARAHLCYSDAQCVHANIQGLSQLLEILNDSQMGSLIKGFKPSHLRDACDGAAETSAITSSNLREFIHVACTRGNERLLTELTGALKRRMTRLTQRGATGELEAIRRSFPPPDSKKPGDRRFHQLMRQKQPSEKKKVTKTPGKPANTR